MNCALFLLVTILIYNNNNLVLECSSAKILAIVPTPSYSHQVTFRLFFKELAARGHEITLMTTDIMNDRNSTIKEINLNKLYTILEKHKFVEYASSNNFTLMGLISKFIQLQEEAFDELLCNKEILHSIESKENYDLLIVEFLMTAPAAFSYKFNIPFIGIVSMDSPQHGHEVMGNSIHPIVYPDYNLGYNSEMTLRERIFSILLHLFFKMIMLPLLNHFQNIAVKKCLGEMPPIQDIVQNMSMLFINANPLFTNNRALGPNTINIGGAFHLNKPQPLPKDLQEILDGAKEGAIYFSLGSNVKSNDLSNKTRDIILESFSELPYIVLWKFEDENLPEKPSNVYIKKWFPQQDILGHPNVKLFITQGGLQSLEETISSLVPIVGIPFFGDQFNNINKMVNRGMGLSLDRNLIDKQNFQSTIMEVLKNPKYRKKVKEMSSLILDQPISGLDRAIWWTEYVIRHRGADFLKHHIVNIPWYQYYFLDVGFVFFILFAVSSFILYWFIKILVKIFQLVYEKWLNYGSNKVKIL